jgi:hypothetical protein
MQVKRSHAALLTIASVFLCGPAALAEDHSNAVYLKAAPMTIAAAAAVASAPIVTAQAFKSWSQPNGSGYLVMVRTTLTASRDVTVSAGDFTASIATEAGLARTFVAMTGPARAQETKNGLTDALGLSSISHLGGSKPIVDPKEDFGAMGQVALKATIPATIVLTFSEPNAVAGTLTIAYHGAGR